MKEHKRIVIWCGDAPNQKALANKIAEQFPVTAIVVEKKPSVRKYNLRTITEKMLDRTVFNVIGKTWQKLMRHYHDMYPQFPDTHSLFVASINADEVYEFTAKENPDLIIVSGTSLIRKKNLSLQPLIGIINLHTGLSPYVKGGPNCTNWCIANEDWHLVGNTIMWINAGIDTGNIITSERININDCGCLFDAHLKVMEHAHDLYLKAISYLLSKPAPFVSVPQEEITKGQLYLTKMWDNKAKARLLSNWSKRKKAQSDFNPKTISLPDE